MFPRYVYDDIVFDSVWEFPNIIIVLEHNYLLNYSDTDNNIILLG